MPAKSTKTPEAESVAALVKEVRRIELITRGIVRNKAGGEYHSVFKGQGIDFDDFREYQPGDEVRSIDWNVTARQGTPFIRKYVEERELTVYVAVDVSGSTLYGSGDQSMRMLAARVAAAFAFSAIHNQDKCGLVLFSDEVELFLPPSKSRRQALRMIREILYVQPRGRTTNPRPALDLITRHTNKRCLVLLLSDFQFPGLTDALRIAAIRHDVVAIQLSDPAQAELPRAGRIRLSDPETGEEIVVNTQSARVRAQYAQLRAAWQAGVEQSFRSLAVDTIPVSTDSDYQPALHAFFRKREKRR
ncbi:MAG: DUF58 domain-containing protein [Verrucomicrobiales bacterium]